MVMGKAGSLEYMAPEVACGGFHSSPCDIWSLGKTLITVLNGGWLNVEHREMLSILPMQRPTAAQLCWKFQKISYS